MKYNFIYINIFIQNKDILIIVFIIKTNILKTIEQKKENNINIIYLQNTVQ